MTRKLAKSIKFKQAPAKATAGSILARKTGPIYTDSDSSYVGFNKGGGAPADAGGAPAAPPPPVHGPGMMSRYAGRTGIIDQGQFQPAAQPGVASGYAAPPLAAPQPPLGAPLGRTISLPTPVVPGVPQPPSIPPGQFQQGLQTLSRPMPLGQPPGQPPVQPLGQPLGQPPGQPPVQPLGQPPVQPPGQPPVQPLGQPLGAPRPVVSLGFSGQPLQPRPLGAPLPGSPAVPGASQALYPPVGAPPPAAAGGIVQPGGMEAIFDQIRDYLEVCESLMDDDWSPMDIIDNINLLVRDMNFDVVSMVLIDEETPNKFAMPVSRGYRMPPPPEVVACWSEAFEGRVELDWDKLVAVAGRRDSALAAWIVKEDLRSFAYIPIHDQESIHGFLFIGSRKSIKLTPMASNIMELCGGRIGLSLTARELFGKWPDFVSEAVKQLKDQLSVAMGSLEMAVESAVAAPEELRSLIAQCAAAVQGCVQIVDSLGAQADSPPG